MLLESFYLERGLVIDSLYKIVANCEEVGAMTMRSFERERAAFRGCEALSIALMAENKQLKRAVLRGKVFNYALIAVLSGTVTYMAFK